MKAQTPMTVAVIGVLLFVQRCYYPGLLLSSAVFSQSFFSRQWLFEWGTPGDGSPFSGY